MFKSSHVGFNVWMYFHTWCINFQILESFSSLTFLKILLLTLFVITSSSITTSSCGATSNGVPQTSQLHSSPSSVKHSTFRILWTAGPEIQGDLDWVPLCFSRWLCILLFDPLWIHFVAQMSECNRIYFPALGPSRPREKRSCDGQPLRWPPKTLASWISCTLYSPLLLWMWQAGGSDRAWLLRLRDLKTLKLLPCFLWGKLDSML